jgi:hypothetical protein
MPVDQSEHVNVYTFSESGPVLVGRFKLPAYTPKQLVAFQKKQEEMHRYYHSPRAKRARERMSKALGLGA